MTRRGRVFKTPAEAKASLIGSGVNDGISLITRADIAELPVNPSANFVIENAMDAHNEGREFDRKKDHKSSQPHEIKIHRGQNLREACEWLAKPVVATWRMDCAILDLTQAISSNRATDTSQRNIEKRMRDGVAGFVFMVQDSRELFDESRKDRAKRLRNHVLGLDIPVLKVAVVDSEQGILDAEQSEEAAHDLLITEGVFIPPSVYENLDITPQDPQERLF